MEIFQAQKRVLWFLMKASGVALLLFSTVIHAAEVTVNFTPQTSSVKEGGSIQMRVSVSGDSGCRVGVKTSGNASKGRDYSISANGTDITAALDNFFVNLETASASDAIGSGSALFVFSAVGKDAAETNETVTFIPDVKSPCTLSANSSNATVTIIDDGTALVSNNLTASFSSVAGEVKKGAGGTNIANIKFSLPTGKRPDAHCKAVARVNVVGGSAVAGTDFNFTSFRLDYGSGDGNSKTQRVNLDVLAGVAGSGDKTVILETTFLSAGAGGSNSCPLISPRTQKITVTLKDTAPPPPPVTTPVTATASISATASLVQENDTVEVNYAFGGNTSACDAIHPVVIANKTTAKGDQYELDTSVNLLENPRVAVKILRQDPLKETIVVLGASAQGCSLATDNTISFKISKKAAIDTTDTTDTVIDPVTIREEPEDLKDQACSSLALQDKSSLTADDKSFFNSNCKEDDTRNFEPEEVSAQSVGLVLASGRQLRNIHSRLHRLRITKGRRGVDVSNATLNIQGSTVSVGLLGGAAGDDENSLVENSRWGFFANGEYAFGKEDRGDDSAKKGGDRNFDFNTTGLTFGADYRFPGEKIIAGAALGYKDFDSDFATQSGGTSVKGYNLNLYGTYLLSDKAYLDATVGLGSSQLDSRRPINNDGTGGIGNTATFAIGKPDASEFVFSVGGGYEFYKGDWSLTPYGRMDYIKGTIDAYTESASHISARTSVFKIDKQDVEALTSTLGLKASRVISTSRGVFLPYASAEWRHDFKDRGAITGSSIYLNKKFGEGDRSEFDRNYYNLGVGVSAQFPKGKSAFLAVESRQGDSVVEDTAVRAGIRMEF